MNLSPRFNHVTINDTSFLPIKPTSQTDIAYDCKALLLDDEGQPTSLKIKKGESVVVPLGFSIEQPEPIYINQNCESSLGNSEVTQSTLLKVAQVLEEKINLNIDFQNLHKRGVSTLKITQNPLFKKSIVEIINEGIFNLSKSSDVKVQQNNCEHTNNHLIKLVPSAEIHSRSGLGFKKQIVAFNGQVDNLFNKHVHLALTNHSNKTYEVNFGDRVCQIELKLVWLPEIESNEISLEQLNNVKAKREGFGSSGK